MNTTTAIRRGVAVAVLAALAGACSNGSAVAPKPRPTTTTTTIPVLNALDLAGALPQPGAAPVGWTATGTPVQTVFTPDQGPGKGACGGANGDARAQNNGGVATATASYHTAQPSGSGSITLYAFSSPEAARDFLTVTSQQWLTCPQGVKYDRPEAELHGFGNGANPNAVWHVTETDGVSSAGKLPGDGSLALTESEEFATDDSGGHFGFSITNTYLAEQHGDVVILVTLQGQGGMTGFSNSDQFQAYTPNVVENIGALHDVRAGILAKLGKRPSLPAAPSSRSSEQTSSTSAKG